MNLLSSWDLRSGKKADKSLLGSLSQPVQFLPEKEKTDEWKAWTIDWIELQGIKQLRQNSSRLLKNIKLTKGIIDKADYIVEADNEQEELIDLLTRDVDEGPMELKFYPIIPSIVNILTGEFSKRRSKIVYSAVDQISHNEMVEQKRQMIEDVLLQQAQFKMGQKLIEMGMDPMSEEGAEQMSMENLQTLPQIQEFFNKEYKSMIEEWAEHQHNVDEGRFRMYELEEQAFAEMLAVNREFWHFRMMEDDYEVELWNPLLTFYHASPGNRYTSQGNWVGKIGLLTLPDVLDKYGWMMDEEQMKSLEDVYPVKAMGYLDPNKQNDGGFYDATKSHEWNTEMPSLAMRQFNSAKELQHRTGDILEDIMAGVDDFQNFGAEGLIRETVVYWKTQRRFGHLTKITQDGAFYQDIIDESYKVTDKPLYNTTVYKTKTKDNLIFGEHIDWIWINETYGGIKLSMNKPTQAGNNHDGAGFDNIYLGINGGKPGRLPFQFKGDSSLYGCKLPVEGAVFDSAHTRSVSLVDTLKPFQIGYNMVNNQIADILVDELGTVVMLDQNAIPKNSLGEDWGKGNYARLYGAMKDFQIAPMDTSISNTENALNFQHYQVLNLEQTNRLMSRVSLSNYFKQEAFAAVGINPQRTAEQLSQSTATGVEQAVQASYAQTEKYFAQHSDYLMPRVHQMRTDLSQYYHSTNPSVRLQYVTTDDMKVNFQIDGTKLLLRDLNVFCTTRTNHKAILDQFKNIALTNNTSGATIFDLGNVIKADSIAELTRVVKASEEKSQAQIQAQRDHEAQLQQQMDDAAAAALAEANRFEAEQNELDRQARIIEAQIAAASRGNGQDMDANAQSDFLDNMNFIQKQQEYSDTMNFKRSQEANKTTMEREKLAVERQKIQAQREMKQKELQIARENQTKAELQAKRKIAQDKK